MNSLADSIWSSGAGQMILPVSVFKDGVAWYSGNSTRDFFGFDWPVLEAALLFIVFSVFAFFVLLAVLDDAFTFSGFKSVRVVLTARSLVRRQVLCIRRRDIRVCKGSVQLIPREELSPNCKTQDFGMSLWVESRSSSRFFEPSCSRNKSAQW